MAAKIGNGAATRGRRAKLLRAGRGRPDKRCDVGVLFRCRADALRCARGVWRHRRTCIGAAAYPSGYHEAHLRPQPCRARAPKRLRALGRRRRPLGPRRSSPYIKSPMWRCRSPRRRAAVSSKLEDAAMMAAAAPASRAVALPGFEQPSCSFRSRRCADSPGRQSDPGLVFYIFSHARRSKKPIACTTPTRCTNELHMRFVIPGGVHRLACPQYDARSSVSRSAARGPSQSGSSRHERESAP
jgi:hypothetical protein